VLPGPLFFIIAVKVVFSPGFGLSGYKEIDSIVKSGSKPFTFTVLVNSLLPSLLSDTVDPESISIFTSIGPLLT
jgi:hypothetical protein